MASIEVGNFDSPDGGRAPDKTLIEVVQLGAISAARVTYQPGWKWSECVGPVVGSDSCHARHIGLVVSGRLHVRHADGTEGEAGPGDTYVIEPDHDGWVVGDEPFIAFEFDPDTADSYAKMKV